MRNLAFEQGRPLRADRGARSEVAGRAAVHDARRPGRKGALPQRRGFRHARAAQGDRRLARPLLPLVAGRRQRGRREVSMRARVLSPVALLPGTALALALLASSGRAQTPPSPPCRRTPPPPCAAAEATSRRPSSRPRTIARLLALFEGLRVADATDGMDAVGLPGVGLMDPELRPLWKDNAVLQLTASSAIAVTARYVPTQRAARRPAVASKTTTAGRVIGTSRSRPSPSPSCCGPAARS